MAGSSKTDQERRFDFSRPLSECKPQDCDEVTGCAGDDEEVPEEVAIAKPYGREKSDPRGVSNSAGQEPEQRIQRPGQRQDLRPVQHHGAGSSAQRGLVRARGRRTTSREGLRVRQVTWPRAAPPSQPLD